MKPCEVEKIVECEKEWRRYVVVKVDSLEREVSTLKGRVAVVSAIVGSAFSLFFQWIKIKMGIA